MNVPASVTIVEVGPRDGLQNEPAAIATADKVEIHDLHATMLHLLGIEHTRSTFRFGGRDMRLTDVHGNIVKEILA